MLAVDRRNSILEIIHEKKSVLVSDMAKKFNVTEETIRRDLILMEEKGLLTRTHGGAFIQDGVENSVDYELRMTTCINVKQSIAKVTEKLVNNGDSIFLDCSTTAYYVASVIKYKRITVVTNSWLIANELMSSPSVKLILIGGEYSPENKSFEGLRTIQEINNYFFDKCFISCRSLSKQYGVSDSLESLMAIRSKVLQKSKERYLIVDNNKFDRDSFYFLAEIGSFNAIISDYKYDDEWKEIALSVGTKLISAN